MVTCDYPGVKPGVFFCGLHHIRRLYKLLGLLYLYLRAAQKQDTENMTRIIRKIKEAKAERAHRKAWAAQQAAGCIVVRTTH